MNNPNLIFSESKIQACYLMEKKRKEQLIQALAEAFDRASKISETSGYRKDLTEEEAQQLADEAVAFARTRRRKAYARLQAMKASKKAA